MEIPHDFTSMEDLLNNDVIAKFKPSLPLQLINCLYGYNEGLFLPSSYIVLSYDFEQVILSILDLHICFFNRCFLIQLKK